MAKRDTDARSSTSEPTEQVSESRRKLLGGMGKLAYAAPTLTVLTLLTRRADAVSLPPCAPHESPPGCTPVGPASTKQKSRVKRRGKTGQE